MSLVRKDCVMELNNGTIVFCDVEMVSDEAERFFNFNTDVLVLRNIRSEVDGITPTMEIIKAVDGGIEILYDTAE